MDKDLKFYTVSEVMNLLRMSKRTTYKLVHKPDFSKIRIDNRYLIPKKDFDKFIQRNMYKQYKI